MELEFLLKRNKLFNFFLKCHHSLTAMGHGQRSNKQFQVSTFWGFSVSKGTDDLPNAVLGADAIRPHVSSFYYLCCSDISVGGFC